MKPREGVLSTTSPGPGSGVIHILITIVIALGPGCEPAQPLDMTGFIAKLDSLRIDAHIPGLAVAVVYEGRVLQLAGLGYADMGNRVPVRPGTPFNIASVTKPIAATVALMLRKQGVLDLEAPMVSYRGFTEFCVDVKVAGGLFFDDWACDDPRLTLRHVLSMTANGVPGERLLYNPVSFSWASRPMAQVTGKTFSTLVKELIFDPVGMPRSVRVNRDLPLPPDLASALAVPYHMGRDSTLQRSEQPPRQGDGAAGGVISTVEDLAAFDRALDGGVLLDAADRREMWTQAAPEVPYGLGWFIGDVAGERVVWHTGLWEGAYSALYLKVPARRATLILLANSDGLRWDTRLDEAVLDRSPFARAFLQLLSRPRATRAQRQSGPEGVTRVARSAGRDRDR